MNHKISSRDLELLSLYLDKQLNQKDNERLRSRLQTDPDLREALNGLRKTKAALRSLSAVRAPRSFRLTPEMIGSRPARPVYPFFQFASALATVLLILFVVGDAFLSAGKTSTALAPGPARLVANDTASSKAVVSTNQVELAAPGAQVGGASADQAPSQPTEPAGQASAAQALPQVMAPAPPITSTMTTEKAVGGLREQPKPAASAAAPVVPYSTFENTSVPDQVGSNASGTFSTTLSSLPPSEAITVTVAPASQQAEQAEPTTSPGPLPQIRIIEGLLGLIAIATGIAAVLLRRKSI